MIHIIHVINPVQPSDRRKTYEVPFVSGKHLDEYLLQIFAACDTMVVSVNGGIVPPDLWMGVILRDEDCVVVSPVVAGGSLIRTLASIAVLATAAIVTDGASLTLAGFTLGFTGLGLSATASAIVSAGITIGGNLLISAFSGSTPSTKSDTASYDPDGPKSLARSGTVIPKGYGKFRWGGNVISSYTDLEGPDQYINALACYGFGPARSIDNIQVNGKDISTYTNVQYYTRLGLNDQNPIPNFNRVVNGYPQDVQCLAGHPVVVPGTGDQTQGLQVDIQFPTGVFVLTKDGNYIPGIVSYLIEFQKDGTPDWMGITIPDATQDVVTYDVQGNPTARGSWCVMGTDLSANSGVLYQIDNGPHTPGDAWSGDLPLTIYDALGGTRSSTRHCTGEWQLLDTKLNQILVTSFKTGYTTFTACDTQPLYNRTSIYGLPTGKYNVRVTKYGSARLHDTIVYGDNASPLVGQQVWIHSINEISNLDLAYPNMILIGIRALATNQINGSNISITAEITHGLRTVDEGMLPAALQAYEESNPACVAADMMLDPLYGGGQSPGILASNITRYIDEWIAWAELNDELVPDGNGGSIRRHVFNGVFDDEGDLWSQVSKVSKMSRAALIPLGRDYGVFVDAPSDPVQMFTMGNIVQDSFQEIWLAIDDRANQVEIQFADSTRYYRTDNPLVYMDPAKQDAGVAVKNVRIDGKGVTSPAQAWHLARFKERNNQFLLRTGSFKCDTDAIACRAGNVVILQHDVTEWGWGGRLLPGSTASALRFDRDDFPFVTGTDYNVIVMLPALKRYAGTVSSVAVVTDSKTNAVIGTQIGLATFDNENRVTRAIINGVDSPISSSAVNSILIQPSAGFAAAVGDAFELWDTDVLETRAVSGISAVDGSVILSASLSADPPDFSTYFYGPVGTQKLVRVTNIRKASEFRSTIEWLDYDAANVYVDAVPVIGETSALNTSKPGVTSLVGSENVQKVSGSYVGSAQLTWQIGPDTVGVGIYGYIVGGNTTTSNALPLMLARLTNYPTSWSTQVSPGQTWKYFVVGFDKSDNYAAFSSAPNVTIQFEGIAANLLLGSNFATGFTYWNRLTRTGDTLVPNFANDGQADYTVVGSPLTAAQTMLYQVIPPSDWAVGDHLMLSAYFLDSCVASSAPNVGSLRATIVFRDSTGTLISSVDVPAALSGIVPTLVRVNSPSVVIPSGTATVLVQVGVGGSSVNVPVGSIFTVSHLLLEISAPGQTVPSEWADIDAAGNILDLFTTGSSTGLRVQSSTLPSFTGRFDITYAADSLGIAWVGFVIAWPDAAYTIIQDSALATIGGLAASTSYYAYPFFDVYLGGINFVVPTTVVAGTGILSATYDALADAATRQDGRVSLAPGGMLLTTTASGTSTGSGGGNAGGTGSGGGSGSSGGPGAGGGGGVPLPPGNDPL